MTGTIGELEAPFARLEQQLRFVVELDRLKLVLRATSLCDGSRRENSAEHSWHLAMLAVVMAEYAPPGTDLLRALKMALIHDVVEIDAGDAFCYDPAATEGKEERERLAADRLFGMLPEDQARELRGLWDEYEERRTPDAKFANALDRLQPMLQNMETGGGTWARHGVHRDSVRRRMEPIADGMPDVWPYVEDALARAIEAGWLK